ncbi:MAG TPA: dephospho-CoA kinase [Candidatus Acidoferrales bacterium]|nr:dephospho-CoA kinase [Candidatus Acidoferrales bacterium]
MLRVGLTGGIASGKTAVAALLRAHGYEVLDADALGHELMRPGQAAYDDILREFGRDVLAEDMTVDRARLGAIVFGDEEKRAALNCILHPRILDAVQRWFAALDRAGGPPFAFVEAALLVEAGYRRILDRLIVCWSKPEQQNERLVARGLSAEQARLRVAAQMPIEEKRRVADDVIDCSGSLAETERQVEKLLETLNLAAGTPRNIS